MAKDEDVQLKPKESPDQFNKDELRDILENSELDQIQRIRDEKRQRRFNGFGGNSYNPGGNDRRRGNTGYNTYRNQTFGEKNFHSQNRPYYNNQNPNRNREYGQNNWNYTKREFKQGEFNQRNDFGGRPSSNRNWGNQRQSRPEDGGIAQDQAGGQRYGENSAGYNNFAPRYGDRAPKYKNENTQREERPSSNGDYAQNERSAVMPKPPSEENMPSREE
jgi:hypothetical protein